MNNVQSVVFTLIIKIDIESLAVAVSINIAIFLWFRYSCGGDKFFAVWLT
jgi:hypothetical protein